MKAVVLYHLATHLCLVAHAAERDAPQRPAQHLRHRAHQARLAHARRANKAQDGCAHAVRAAQAHHSQVLHNALLHFIQPRVVAVQQRARSAQVLPRRWRLRRRGARRARRPRVAAALSSCIVAGAAAGPGLSAACTARGRAALAAGAAVGRVAADVAAEPVPRQVCQHLQVGTRCSGARLLLAACTQPPHLRSSNGTEREPSIQHPIAGHAPAREHCRLEHHTSTPHPPPSHLLLCRLEHLLWGPCRHQARHERRQLILCVVILSSQAALAGQEGRHR